MEKNGITLKKERKNRKKKISARDIAGTTVGCWSKLIKKEGRSKNLPTLRVALSGFCACDGVRYDLSGAIDW